MAGKLRVNQEIRIREVRVIGPNSEQLGILAIGDALKRAEEAGLDLVEVAPTASPPVCRIIDYGKYRYEQAKKQHGAKQKSAQLKEVKLRPFTDTHDLEFKTRHARDFLAEGHKVKITVMFRGREMAHQEAGRNVLAKVIEQLGSAAQVEQQPRMEGRNMSILLAPKH
ncbi:MAG: translation initiation factor IF-3 [Nitrospirota bacterium]